LRFNNNIEAKISILIARKPLTLIKFHIGYSEVTEVNYSI